MESQEPQAKKRRAPAVLPHEHLYLANLPTAGLYEKSYMHRDSLSHVVCSKAGNIMTASVDGYLKFWRRAKGNNGEIEFIKTFRAHNGPITSLALSNDGLWLASASLDQTIKIFDVLNFGTCVCSL
jgi:peptidylprolyl isomerase domain and WD repeat-containing protein 1